jgi:proline dehydrogenase
VAGDSLETGIEAAQALLGRGLLTTLDLLYEGITEPGQIEDVRAVYRDMVPACARFEDAATRPTVSLKPSSYTTHPLDRGEGMDARGSEEAIREIVDRAAEQGVGVTIDMEDRHWTDWTLDLAGRLRAEGKDHVGIVLQTRLNRTEADIQALPEGIRVRLVIGIYNEPDSVAIRDKHEMKERMLRYAGQLLERGHFVEIGTHDEPYIRRFLTEVVPAAGVGPDQYEIQMLYGVPRDSFHQELLRGGIGSQGPVRVRLYVPFATSWTLALAYLRRRLLENPSMVFAVGRNLLRVLSLRR